MSAMIIGVVLLMLVGLGVALYFVLGGKKCKDHESQDECKAPCKWDTYGYKCIDKDTDPTPAPPSDDDPEDNATVNTGSRNAPAPVPIAAPTTNKWNCYAGRYGDVYAAYQSENSLDAAEQHYEEFGRAKKWSTSCNLSADETACYTLQNPEVFSNFGYTLSKTNSTARKIAKYYKDYGIDDVARFNCQGGQLGETVFPDTAAIIGPREFNVDRRRSRYTNILKSPNGLYTLRLYFDGRLFLTKGRQNIKTILDGRRRKSDEDDTDAELENYTYLRFWFGGGDGNIFMRWYKEGTNNYGYNVQTEGSNKKHHLYTTTFLSSDNDIRNAQVPRNQHALVLTDEGVLYVDHGLGEGEEMIIYEAD